MWTLNYPMGIMIWALSPGPWSYPLGEDNSIPRTDCQSIFISMLLSGYSHDALTHLPRCLEVRVFRVVAFYIIILINDTLPLTFFNLFIEGLDLQSSIDWRFHTICRPRITQPPRGFILEFNNASSHYVIGIEYNTEDVRGDNEWWIFSTRALGRQILWTSQAEACWNGSGLKLCEDRDHLNSGRSAWLGL